MHQLNASINLEFETSNEAKIFLRKFKEIGGEFSNQATVEVKEEPENAQEITVYCPQDLKSKFLVIDSDQADFETPDEDTIAPIPENLWQQIKIKGICTFMSRLRPTKILETYSNSNPIWEKNMAEALGIKISKELDKISHDEMPTNCPLGVYLAIQVPEELCQELESLNPENL